MESLASYGQAPAPANAPPVSEAPPPEKRQKTADSALPEPGAPPARRTPDEIHAELEKRLPAEPDESQCDPVMLKKITAAVNAKQSVVARLRQHTAFKNPEIMGQLVQFVQIDEKGSNYPKAQYDPACPGYMNHRQLAEEQNAYLMDLQQRGQAPVPEASGNAASKPESGVSSSSASNATRKGRKKSRFDVAPK